MNNKFKLITYPIVFQGCLWRKNPQLEELECEISWYVKREQEVKSERFL
jgi:hypothetical protein